MFRIGSATAYANMAKLGTALYECIWVISMWTLRKPREEEPRKELAPYTCLFLQNMNIIN